MREPCRAGRATVQIPALFFFMDTHKSLLKIRSWGVSRQNKQLSMKKNERQNYETPQVEIVEVEVEKGFIGSGDGEGTTPGFDPN